MARSAPEGTLNALSDGGIQARGVVLLTQDKMAMRR
jgi:hypothetical protein